MPGKTIIRNEDISYALLAAPESHKHLRLAIVLKDGGTIVLQEATVAAIVRAYTAVKTHPQRRAVKMESTPLAERKRGYAEHQLMETGVPDSEAEAEMTKLLG